MRKPIRFSGHAQGQMLRRGVLAKEVETTIRTMPWQATQRNRLECRCDFPYNGEWNGKFYQIKQVRPIFVDEADEIVIVTVYSYYF